MTNYFKYFYPTHSIKRKILDIKDSIKLVIRPFCKEKYWIESYGAYEIDPKNLVFWICTKSDKMKFELESNNELAKKLRDILFDCNYPKEAIPFVNIGFESQETVDRESNGNWYVHFK